MDRWYEVVLNVEVCQLSNEMALTDLIDNSKHGTRLQIENARTIKDV